MQKRIEDLGAIGTLAAIYFLAGKLGLSLAFVHLSSAAVWPPAGITLAAFLILGDRVWPGIFLGSFFVNLTTTGSILTSIGIATGNTLGGVVGTYLVSRFANGRKSFDNARDILKFAILAGMLSTTVSATFGVTSPTLGGFASWSQYKPNWLTWWLGDAVGDVVVAPLLILWSSDRQIRLNWTRLTEFVILIVCLLLVGQVVFCGLFLSRANNYPIEYLCIPFLIWAAFRFGQREAATVTAILSGIAVWGTS